MELTVSRIDINKTAENWPADMPFKPAMIVKQPTMHPDDWWVADAPIPAPEDEISWAFAKHDQYIRIPLFKYQLSTDASLAFARVLSFGLSCAGKFPGRLKKLHVVTGKPVDLLYDADINKGISLQCWLGFAVVVHAEV